MRKHSLLGILLLVAASLTAGPRDYTKYVNLFVGTAGHGHTHPGAIVPAIILALLRATESGDNFWLLMGGVLLVYIVVQIIQDILVTPHVMGKIMGLSPAIILLALSVGGYLLGILGLILALPVTTLLLLYYKQYFVEEHPALK